jgi:halimadienyl-diphosphate synthase
VLATQRADGSWGRWEGTLEETAYAMQTLLLPERVQGHAMDERYARAAARGLEYAQHGGEMSDYPSLWHDKDLYTPIAIVRAAILAALHLGSSA